MIEICKTCGRRRYTEDMSFTERVDPNVCIAEAHTEVVAVTDNQARDLAIAAKAYNSAREVEDRASAMNDWLCVLTDGLSAPEPDQMELA